MLFASLVIEHEPLGWHDLPGLLETLVRNGGLFALVALLIYGIYDLVQRPSASSRLPWPAWEALLFRLALLGIAVGYGAFLVLLAPELLARIASSVEGESARAAALGRSDWQKQGLLLGGACALFAVALPFFADLRLLRWRRIWALARLSFKEAIRRRVLWVFSLLLLVFLFASWFLPAKPENQLRNYVQVVSFVMTVLLLFTAGLVAAFSIPNDVRNQTIHTIVTKPVERFEIVLGRFLGYTLLMSLVLAVMTGISLLYVFREIDIEARDESMRARVPLYARLDFTSKDQNFRGSDVGREWGYRKYITGGAGSSQRALWFYNDLPPDLASRADGKVPCEFSFDIFRTLKGEEGKGVFCSFEFLTSHWDDKQLKEFQQEREQERKKPDANPEQIDKLLAEKYGRYEVYSKEVVDYHTQSINLPTALFRNAQATDKPTRQPSRLGEEVPQLLVRVKCESGGQYLGVAKHDFYLLATEGRFEWNFFKGAAGLWLRLCLVIGIAVTLSTYLSGIISFMTTMFLYIAGLFEEFVRNLAEGKSIGGGPAESFRRLINRESLVTQFEQTPAGRLAQVTDEIYKWWFGRFLDIVPGVNRLDWSDYVSEGFNIAFGNMIVVHIILVVIYLLPCALIAYYLMKSREIAS
jgi:hypothetical protein